MKYVKKPVVVEAFQFGVDEEPEWFVRHDKEGSVRRLFQSGNPINSNYYQHKVEIYNKRKITFETVFYGDMIIKGIEGEIYSCKKEMFDASYEPYNENPVLHN